MSSGPVAKSVIGPLTPLSVAVAPVNVSEPKLASDASEQLLPLQIRPLAIDSADVSWSPTS